MSSDTIDHLSVAQGRLITEYRESVNLINNIRTLLLEANTLEEVYCSLIEDRTIDTATGITLDILGSIVGQPREFVTANFINFFAFKDTDGNFPINTSGLGTLDNINAGGLFKSVNDDLTGTIQLDDERYRLFIRARIARNFSKATPEDVIANAKFVTESSLVILEELEDAAYNLKIGRVFTDDEQAIILALDFIPKPAGVNVNYFDFELGNVFAFAGITDAKGFDEAPFINPFV